MFQVLQTAFDAWRARGEITFMGFAELDADNYRLADESIDDSMQAYMSGEFDAAMGNAWEALARYGIVLSSGWAAAAVEARAYVSVREIFEEAVSLRATAADSLLGERYEEAAGLFADAGLAYRIAATIAQERRRFAAEAIFEANRLINERVGSASTADFEAD
jgi:hypothetical protein